jgi:hypothetical protein
MKPKPIIADPLILDRAGISTTRQAAIFIHIGRCGLIGTTIPQITEALAINHSTVRETIYILSEDLKLVTEAGRSNTKGRAFNYVVTIRGWQLLTSPADFSMFQHAQDALVRVKPIQTNTP